MIMEHKEWYRPSSSEEGEIYSQMYTCENPKGIIQIAHGLSERSERYKEFMVYLANNGYIVCANDHLGHGMSGQGEWGIFAKKAGGFDYVIQDMHTLFEEVGEAYPNLPKILLGQSMGSILSALFADRFDYLSKLILMGTPAYNKLVGIGVYALQRSVKKHGYAHKSNIWNRIIWGKEPKEREKQIEHHGWLTSDVSIVEAFIDDELCGAPFYDSANLEMLAGLKKWGSGNWGKHIPDIPILFMAGTKDKVSEGEKGPTYYYNLLKDSHSHLTLKIIEGNQHEVLNEKNRMDTYLFILQWLSA